VQQRRPYWEMIWTKMKARIEKQRIPEAESGGREYTRQCREKVKVLNEEAHNLLKPRQCYSYPSVTACAYRLILCT
jgi:hypothetical protein